MVCQPKRSRMRRPHGRLPTVPCPPWNRDGAAHPPAQSEAPAARPDAPQGLIPKLRVMKWSSHLGTQPAPRTKFSATSASIRVAEIGAGNVTERVTERISAKRTRIVTVLTGRDLARSRVVILSARRSSVGRKTRSSAGFLPSADCAPADCDRRWVLISRGSRF